MSHNPRKRITSLNMIAHHFLTMFFKDNFLEDIVVINIASVQDDRFDFKNRVSIQKAP